MRSKDASLETTRYMKNQQYNNNSNILLDRMDLISNSKKSLENEEVSKSKFSCLTKAKTSNRAKQQISILSSDEVHYKANTNTLKSNFSSLSNTLSKPKTTKEILQKISRLTNGT